MRGKERYLMDLTIVKSKDVLCSFKIIGKAQAKQRPRVLKTGITYTPKETVQAESFIKMLAKQAMTSKPSTEPLQLCIQIKRRIPKSFSDKKRSSALTGEIKPTTRPDIDNQVKLIKDALNGVCWIDDSQVCKLSAEKVYAEDEETCVTIMIIS